MLIVVCFDIFDIDVRRDYDVDCMHLCILKNILNHTCHIESQLVQGDLGEYSLHECMTCFILISLEE